MKILYPTLCTLILVFFTSCAPKRFIARDFEEEAAKHETIAVLPFKVIYTGKIPEDATEEDLVRASAMEGLAYQSSFHHQLLQARPARRRRMKVRVQDYRSTRAALDTLGIGVAESWKMAPEQLAKRLDVDAVVSGTIHTKRLLTDKQSFGIDVARRVINAIPTNGRIPRIGGAIARSAELEIRYSLISENLGSVLWSFSCRGGSNWQRQPDETINYLNYQAARRFPY